MPSTLTHSICLLPRGRISLFSGQWLHIGVHAKQSLLNQFNSGASSHSKKELSFRKHVLSTYCAQGNPVRKWSESGEWYTKMCSSQFRKTLWGKHHEENMANQNHLMWHIIILLGVHCRDTHHAEFLHNLYGYIGHFSLRDKRWLWVPALQERHLSSMESLWSHQQLENVYCETPGKGSRLDKEPVSTFQGNRGKSSTWRVSMETCASQFSPRMWPERSQTEKPDVHCSFLLLYLQLWYFNTKLCVTYGIKKRTDNRLWPNRCSTALCLEHVVWLGPPPVTCLHWTGNGFVSASLGLALLVLILLCLALGSSFDIRFCKNLSVSFLLLSLGSKRILFCSLLGAHITPCHTRQCSESALKIAMHKC